MISLGQLDLQKTMYVFMYIWYCCQKIFLCITRHFGYS